MRFEDWLVRQYLEWREVDSRRRGLPQFASWLGVTTKELREWMDGKAVPTDGEVLMKLAHHLSDDVYLHIGFIPPNVSLFHRAHVS